MSAAWFRSASSKSDANQIGVLHNLDRHGLTQEVSRIIRICDRAQFDDKGERRHGEHFVEVIKPDLRL